ncbi:MAG: hypothetical protein Q7J45_01300 [bacterium]|nr:hypothetical protein [bacterium]
MQAVLQAPKAVTKRGRPTKYVSGVGVLLEAYMAGCVDVYDVATGRWHVRLPMIEGFALYLGVHRDTLNAWSKKYPEYRDALELLKVHQFTRLINGGLANHYKSWLVIMLLKRNHWHRLTSSWHRRSVSSNNMSKAASSRL